MMKNPNDVSDLQEAVGRDDLVEQLRELISVCEAFDKAPGADTWDALIEQVAPRRSLSRLLSKVLSRLEVVEAELQELKRSRSQPSADGLVAAAERSEENP